ncbi:hypothetical protein BJY01DRAFT_245235 [Aspergillus pseudoustus]|uniref:Carrier domain-containing protein n=1 Tax=Aspergillus pseudoustus TaxID=1810923 RepID=A0ABR4KFI2_9EURO
MPSNTSIALQFASAEDDTLSCTLSIREDLIDRPHLEILLQQIDHLSSTIIFHPTEAIHNLIKYFPPGLLSSHTPTVSEQLIQAPQLAPYHWVDHWAEQHGDWVGLEILESITEHGTITKKWIYKQISETSDKVKAWIAKRGWRNRAIAVLLWRYFMGDAAALFTEGDLGIFGPPENCVLIDINDAKFQNEVHGMNETATTGAEPGDNCYLLYTSGSTKTPKEVLVSRGIYQHLQTPSRNTSVVMCQIQPSWEAWEVISPMLVGRLMCTSTRWFWRGAMAFFALLQDLGPFSWIICVYSSHSVGANLPDLWYLGVGAENISETIIERFVGKPPIVLVNADGPTEITVGRKSHTATRQSSVHNIGTTVGNITIHILDPNQYDSGFCHFHGQLMYRTGDIVRLMANNCSECLGRRDSQPKVRGQRLELEEMSIAVRLCAERSLNVTSMVIPSPFTKKPQLVTFISPLADQHETTTAELGFLKPEYQEWVPQILECCREQLLVYMVPSALLPVSFIPIQISGKADQPRLVALYQSISAADLVLKPSPSSTGTATPQSVDSIHEQLTANEHRVLDILSSVVSVNCSTATQSTTIFQLGIDSLASLTLAAKMREAGYASSAAEILANETLGQLASLPRSSESQIEQSERGVSQQGAAEASRRLDRLDRTFRARDNPISNSSIACIWPCIPLEQSLVSTSKGSRLHLYVNHIIFHLEPNFLLGLLKAAIEDLAHETEVLRTCFALMDDNVVQVVLKPRAAKIKWEQVAVSGEEGAQEHFTSNKNRVAQASSDTDTVDGWLMLSVHHSIFDGASMVLFVERLYLHYIGKTHAKVVDHGPFYRQFIEGVEEGQSIGADVDAYDNITEKPPWKLSEITTRVAEISITAPILLEAIWAIALARHLGRGDVVFDRVMSGRGITVDSVERMRVPLITNVPGRLRIPSTSASLIDLVKTYTLVSLRSLPYQQTALRDIQRFAKAPGQLFSSMLSYITSMPPSPTDTFLVEVESVMLADYLLALEVKAESQTDTMTLRLRASLSSIQAKAGRAKIETMSAFLQDLFVNGDARVDGRDMVQKLRSRIPKWNEEQWSDNGTNMIFHIAQITSLPEGHITRNVSLFALAIDSIIAIRLARRLQDQGIKVSSRDIMRYPSVGALNNYLEREEESPPCVLVSCEMTVHNTKQISLFDPEDAVLDTFTCTPLQTAMIGHCSASGGKGYVHHHVMVFDESVDLERLENAWRAIAERADILETSFHRDGTNSQIRAAVHRSFLMHWSQQAAATSLSDAIEELSQRVSYADMAILQRQPWQVGVISGESQRLLILTMHHCLYDGCAIPLLLQSVGQVYQGEQCEVGSFAKIARMISCRERESFRFWTHSIKHYKNPGLPKSPPPSLGESVHWAETAIPTPVATLLGHSSSLEVTLQTVALLSFGRSLAMLLGQRDVVFRAVVSQRGQYDDAKAPVFGPLFNTVPFRLRLESDLDTSSTLKLDEVQDMLRTTKEEFGGIIGRPRP